MSTARFKSLAIAGLLAVVATAHSQSTSLLVNLGFETGNLTGFKTVRSNVPVVTKERARNGSYSMKSTLKAEGAEIRGNERNEVEVADSHVPINTSLWYGFSIFLPSDYVADNVWELVTQWYPYADEDAEWGRQPTMALSTTKGNWSIGLKTSPDVVTPINHPSISDNNWRIGAYQRNAWADFVFNVRWTHRSDGFLKVWKDGVVVIDHKGPTSYNDKRGPFLKMGLYKGWHKMQIDQVTTRTIFIDDVRIAGANGSYDAVAPAGSKAQAVARKVPAAPSGIVIQ